MKKVILLIMAVTLITGVNVFAAGDLVVNGALSVGTGAAPAYKLDISSADSTSMFINSDKNSGTWLNGSLFFLNVNSTNAGGNALIAAPKHFATGSTGGTLRGALYSIALKGSGTIDAAVGMQNQISLGSSVGNYSITNIRGNEMILTKNSQNTGTHTITNFYGLTSFGIASGSGVLNGTNWRHAYFQNFPDYGGTVDNVSGLWIDKQTIGTNNYGIVLNGDGHFTLGNDNDFGAAIVFGTGQCCKIYSEGGVLKASDAASNITQFSPHDPVTGEWIFYSQNIKTGRTMRVNMEKLVKAVEKLTGEKFMIETFEAVD